MLPGVCHEGLTLPVVETRLKRDFMIFKDPQLCNFLAEANCATSFVANTYIPPESTLTCSQLSARTLCNNNSFCVWIGSSWIGCIDLQNAVLASSYGVVCSLSKLDRETCNAFGNVTWKCFYILYYLFFVWSLVKWEHSKTNHLVDTFNLMVQILHVLKSFKNHYHYF